MDSQLNERTDRQTDGEMHGWMAGWTEKGTDGWSNIEKRTEGWHDEQTKGQVDDRMNGERDGWLVRNTNKLLDKLVTGTMDSKITITKPPLFHTPAYVSPLSSHPLLTPYNPSTRPCFPALPSPKTRLRGGHLKPWLSILHTKVSLNFSTVIQVIGTWKEGVFFQACP